MVVAVVAAAAAVAAVVVVVVAVVAGIADAGTPQALSSQLARAEDQLTVVVGADGVEPVEWEGLGESCSER
jgi:hypothetical protein